MYGESMLSGAQSTDVAVGGYDGAEDEDGEPVELRPRRAAAASVGKNGWASKGRHIEGYNSVDEMDDEDEASEQDYGDDEEEGEVSLESDVDNPDDLSDEDDLEDDLLDGGPKKTLVVKLAVKTPTPEKTRRTRSLTPQKIATNLLEVTTVPAQAVETPVQMELRPTTPPTIKQAPQVTSVNNADTISDVHPVSVSEPMDISQPDTSRTPLSPSLAYRGSPDKNHSFFAGVNVARNSQ
jgi:hypothetical protein